MIWDNAYECEPRKRGVYLAACDYIWLDLPRYLMNWEDVTDLAERSEIWKRAKRCVKGGC